MSFHVKCDKCGGDGTDQYFDLQLTDWCHVRSDRWQLCEECTIWLIDHHPWMQKAHEPA